MSKPARAHGPGRPKDLEKRAAVLDAAKRLFVELGYAGTSMDAVAAAAGVSKLTVYSHFDDKDTLFRKAVRARCQEVLPETLYEVQPGMPVHDAMLAIARRHVALMTNPEAIGIWRAIAGDCPNGSPRLGRLLWEEGPLRTRGLLERFLNRQVEVGALDIDNVPRAACQFLALLKGDLHVRCLLGFFDDPGPDLKREIVATADSAVEMFLRAYAPR